MSYVLSRKAEEDVIGIFQTGIEQFGLSQAERYHEQ
jgi:Plasmid stabilization system protein